MEAQGDLGGWGHQIHDVRGTTCYDPFFFFPFIIKEKPNQNKTKLNAYGIKLKSQFCLHYKRII